MKNKLLKRSNGGFSLVELIVVIAIMAILVGVAVPVYSSYIEKSQKAKDEQLVGEIIHALEIAAIGDSWYQSYPNGGAVGVVVLTENGLEIASDADGKLIENALKETFGDLTQLKLSYDGWNITYQNSSFYKGETELLGKVDNLTTVLQGAISNNKDLVGEKFQEYLVANDIPADDTGKVADAAVLYIAQQTSQADKDGFLEYVTSPDGLLMDNSGDATTELNARLGSPAASAAALYAVAEGYCRYEIGRNATNGQVLMDLLNEATEDLGDQTFNDGNAAVAAVYNSFASISQKAMEEKDAEGNLIYDLNGYFQGQVGNDMNSYLDILSTVDSAQSQVVGNLGQENCFTSPVVTELFTAYSQGGVMLIVKIDKTGAAVIDNPLA